MVKTFFDFRDKIFSIQNDLDFESTALEIFEYQYHHNGVYQQYCKLLNLNIRNIDSIEKIPFMPISFFKTQEVKTESFKSEIIYSSSGTSGIQTSRHFIRDIATYDQSFRQGFSTFYGDVKDYIIIGLLPSYLERSGSSLVYMVDRLIKESGEKDSGFYLNDLEGLARFLKSYCGSKKILLLGVSYALLDLAETYEIDMSKHIVMETGGMKGKRKELTKSELHKVLKKKFNAEVIHSEYGMTELLSQAYAKANGLFECPPWMKVLIREYNDPFSYTKKKSGGINVIDLANISSCAFIATDDLGRMNGDHFEVLGRFDNADLRGCNLLVQ